MAQPRWPAWASWRSGGPPWTVGVEEELILLDPGTWSATNRIGDVLAAAPEALRPNLAAETHACVLEIRTSPATTASGVAAELAVLRRTVDELLRAHGLRAAAAGTHPLIESHEVAVTATARYAEIDRSMRALAHREPTMGLHVHVGVPDGDAAVRALDGLREDVPALIALAANSPFWRGADSGHASMRTPLLSMFPRMGLPRRFGSYAGWVHSVDALVSSGAIADPGFLWWDVRLQPRLGTVEIRAMDVQTRLADTAALVAVVQCLVRRHAGGAPARAAALPEVLAENRFLAARDGMAARPIDAERGRRVPMGEVVERLLRVCEPIAGQLGCAAELRHARDLARDSGAARQRRSARIDGLARLPRRLADELCAGARAPVAAT